MVSKRGAGTRAAVALAKKTAAKIEPDKLLTRLEALADETTAVVEMAKHDLLLRRLEALANETSDLMVHKPKKGKK
jgi:hypothetical protein